MPIIARSRITLIVLACSLTAASAANVDLRVSKSGNDVVLSWTGTGASYDGARATDAPFANATTQFIDAGGTSFTYDGAVRNSHFLEFFDVTDDVGANRGGNWNGGVLPALPPVIAAGNPGTNIGGLHIGGLGTINGSGFSTIPQEILVCFEGGVCTQALTATESSLTFKTPPGAYTGDVTVSRRGQTSAPANATVRLENPATGWSSISQFTFSNQNNSYWVWGTANSPPSVFCVFFDEGSQTWIRENRGGTLSTTTFGCSAQTGRSGRIFCSGGGGFEAATRVIDTDPPSEVANCINLQPTSPGLLISVGSPAVDPNPDSLRADVAYFATSEDGGPSRIRKVAGDCSAELDNNYGNFSTTFGALNNSMVVDPVNGDLYFANDGEITRITTAESVAVVRTGLPANTRLASLTREGPGDPGTLLLVSEGLVQALAMDNLNAAPLPVAIVAGNAIAGFGAQVSGGSWLDANVNRTITVHVNGADLILGDHPLMNVTLSGPFEVRISSPSTTEQFPRGQAKMRSYAVGDPNVSYAITKLQYRDGLSRPTCATVGDPGPGAPQYDDDPSVRSNCNKPRTAAMAICDNVDDIVAGGSGSFFDGGGLTSCKTCGSPQNPCSWEFRITTRYAGDNYKVYFAFDQTAQKFATTSDIYTAWKHLHLELERMCRRGGLLFQDYGATGECGGVGQPACCGTGAQPPCNQILLFSDTADAHDKDVLVVFDEERTFEEVTYTRTVTEEPTNNGNGSLTVKLNSPLPHSVLASDAEITTGQPAFLNGRSGGVCAAAHGFAKSDTSRLPDAFSDGLVGYHVPVYGLEGSGTAPRYSPVDTSTCASMRFSNVWFQQCIPGIGVDCGEDEVVLGCAENNYIHVVAAPRGAGGDALGESELSFNVTYVYVDDIEDACDGTTDGCTDTKRSNYNRSTTRHELAHHFVVNGCSPDNHDDPPRNAWCGELGGTCLTPVHPAQTCLMNVSIPSPAGNNLDADGVDRFCSEDLGLGDPNCVEPREGAMRTSEDPQ